MKTKYPDFWLAFGTLIEILMPIYLACAGLFYVLKFLIRRIK